MCVSLGRCESEESSMDEIPAIDRINEARLPAERHPPAKRDADDRAAQRRARPRRVEPETAAAETHKLNVEA